jgi:hypothetical protein
MLSVRENYCPDQVTFSGAEPSHPTTMVQYIEFLKTLKTKPIHVKRLAVHVVEDVNDHFTDFRQCKDK